MRRIPSLLMRFLPAGGVLLSVLFFGSYATGLLRDRLFAQTFGAGPELDAYNAAFQLPELLLDVLVEAGLAAPFIPIFLRLRANQDPDRAGEAEDFARAILTAAVVVMSAAAVLMFVFAEATLGVIAPGFSGRQRELYVPLFRLMLVTPILFAASLTLAQVQLAERRMFWYGIAPLLYNAGIVAGTLVLARWIGIYAAAVGAILGATLHLGSRFIGLRGSRFRVRFDWHAPPAALREFARLMLPKMISQPVEPLTFVFFNNVASVLAAGSLTVVSYARNFQSVPVSLIGVAFAVAAFPALSTAYAQQDRGAFLRLLGRSVASIAVITLLAAIAMVVVGEVAIRVLLGGGAFGEDDVRRTAAVLGAFALSVPLESITHLLSRAIFATRHTLLQVLSSLAGLGTTVLATLALVDGLGIVAIPLGFAIGQGVKVLLLAASLAVRLRTLRSA